MKAVMELGLDNAMLAPKNELPAIHPSGRVCAHPGCRTVLSIYNGGKYCGVHFAENKGGKRRELKKRG